MHTCFYMKLYIDWPQKIALSSIKSVLRDVSENPGDISGIIVDGQKEKELIKRLFRGFSKQMTFNIIDGKIFSICADCNQLVNNEESIFILFFMNTWYSRVNKI